MCAENFGKMVKKMLIDKNLTQNDLANMVGTSPRYISFILCGQRNAGKYAQPICAALGLKHERMDNVS